MIFISHRGNINSVSHELENTPDYIDAAISQGYEVEIDIWTIKDEIFLGHDGPETPVELKWLDERKKNLWIHTKNQQALEYFTKLKSGFKFFWHTVEPFVLTSNCIIWAHDYEDIKEEQTCIVPLLTLEQVEKAKIRNWYAICTDFPEQCKLKWNTKE